MTNQNEHNEQQRDLNRDPISGSPGSHPVGVGVGGVAGGAAAGALAGTIFGPIGTLIGAGVGVVAGAAAGKGVAERIDPTGEMDYWREEHKNRPYADQSNDFDRDYAAAYGFGLQARDQHGARGLDRPDTDLRNEWEQSRGQSKLEWEQAKHAALDSFGRADRTYATYEASDSHFESEFANRDDRGEQDFDQHRPAYRYGVQARTRYGEREWDDSLQDELKQDWERTHGSSGLSWDEARPSIQAAYGSPYIHTRDNDDRDNPGAGLFRVR